MRHAGSMLCAAALAFAGVCRAAPAELVMTGAAVYTLDPKRPMAQAVAVRGGRIAYVGDDATARGYVGATTRVVELDGHMVLPGFHDSHVHPMSGGMRLLHCRLDAATTRTALEDAVRACAQSQSGPWLLGAGWTRKAFGAHGPSRARLDALVPDRPAFLTTEDGFAGWLNSKALDAAGIAANDEIEGLDRTAGVVRGDAVRRVRRALPLPSQADYRAALRLSTALLNREGVTSVLDAAASPPLIDAYRAADAAGELTVRVVAAQRVDPSAGTDQVAAMVARRASTHGPRFRADAAKLFVDGEIVQGTAALLEPYAVRGYGEGATLLERSLLRDLVDRLDAAGFSIHLHALGDRAVRLGLDAFEHAGRTNGTRDRRHQIAHLGLVGTADVPRFAALGVVANVQPAWAHGGDDAMAPSIAALGAARAGRLYPIASLVRASARVVAGSDWPAPTLRPLDGIQIAVTRQPLDARAAPTQPDQRVGLAAALAMYTRDAAWAVRENNGTIEVGNAADLVVLDRNLFEIPATDIHRARVLLTLLDGEPVYRAPSLTLP
jgi:hypothetical protein